MRPTAALLACACFMATAQGGIKLTEIQFPKSFDGTSGPVGPPAGTVPLSQRVVFRFSAKPKIGGNVADALQIRISSLNSLGQVVGSAAAGTYEVSGKLVIFSPRLPTVSLDDSFGPSSDPAVDLSLPGLVPETIYEIRVVSDVPGGVKNLSKVDGGIPDPLSFSTVAAVPPANAVATYFPDVPGSAAALVPGGIQPKPGSKNVHPNAFEDPAGLFTSITKSKRTPFALEFKGPINPSAANLVGNLRLRMVRDANGIVTDVPIPITPVVTENAVDGARLLVYPHGILPLGAIVSLQLMGAFEALSGSAANPGVGFQEVAGYTVAKDPTPGFAIDDAVIETFETTAHQDTSVAADGLPPATWSSSDGGKLRASFGFAGSGELGRFMPQDAPTVIVLDTDFQSFPLFSGATPQAKAGTIVTNGVFQFTDFHVPPSVTIVGRGSNPLVILATGSVLIEGKIDVSGANGASDNWFDSAIVPVAGGSGGTGGGKGGDGHPVDPPLYGTPTSIVTPTFGASGHGPGNKGLGGGGGQNGCTLPWAGFAGLDCAGYATTLGDGSRGAGGGGGSLNVFFPIAPEDPFTPVSGRRGGIGIGNHLPIVYDPTLPFAPEPDAYSGLPGNPTNAVAIPNPNPTFAAAHAAGLIWDSGAQFDTTTTWAQSKRVTLFGNAGVPIFTDADPTNNFMGPGGECEAYVGGQGGGAGASRTEGLSLQCHLALMSANLPLTVLDARGGGGGGGGGVIVIQAAGPIELTGPSAKIDAKGGDGGGGEGTSSSGRAGAGAGGSGGAVILQSGTNVIMSGASLPPVVIDVSGGCGSNAVTLTNNSTSGTTGGDANVLQVADGGPGGPGIVQFHVPEAAPVQYDATRVNARVFPSVFDVKTGHGDCGFPGANGSASFNPLVVRTLTSETTDSVSAGRSTWYDLGAVTSAFRPPVITSAGAISGPVFGVPGAGPIFNGTNPLTGLVETDAAGNVLNPAQVDIHVDSPDLLKDDFIPNGPLYYQSAMVRFEGADEDPAHPGSPDLSTATGFVTDVTALNGKRFVRFEIRLDIASAPAGILSYATPLLEVDRLRIPFKY